MKHKPKRFMGFDSFVILVPMVSFTTLVVAFGLAVPGDNGVVSQIVAAVILAGPFVGFFGGITLAAGRGPASWLWISFFSAVLFFFDCVYLLVRYAPVGH
ncbi:MAG TPA: hypothetical protein VFB32_16845 [Rudaea sp.]|jgi:hypothetical protein|nr:hypothetical protein [Rudaea sp.]